jgi:hypothetical protein
MSGLIDAFWWLVFPLSWVAISGWNAWLAQKARHEAMDLIQTYVRSGRDAPPELLAKLNKA